MSVLATTFDAARKHPYWLVGGVLVVIVILQLRGSSSKTTSPSGNTGVTTLEEDPNQIAANTALQESANELNAQTTEANDAVAINAANDAVQSASINTEGTLYQNYFNTMASVQNNQTAAAQQVTDQQTSAEENVSELNTETNAITATQGAALAAGLQNETLQNQHYNDVYNDVSSVFGNASNDLAPNYDFSLIENELGNDGAQVNQGWYGDISTAQANKQTAAIATTGNAAVSSYATNTASMLANLFGSASK